MSCQWTFGSGANKRYVVRADEILTAFVELEVATSEIGRFRRNGRDRKIHRVIR